MTFLSTIAAKLAAFFTVDKISATIAVGVAFALGMIATPELQLSAFGIPAATFEPLLVAAIGGIATIYGVNKGA